MRGTRRRLAELERQVADLTAAGAVRAYRAARRAASAHVLPEPSEEARRA